MEKGCAAFSAGFLLFMWTLYFTKHDDLVIIPFQIGKVQFSTRESTTKWKPEQNHSSLYIEYPSLTEEQREELKVMLKRASTKTKYILRWYEKTGKFSVEPTKICGKCEFTSNRSMIDHPDTGAVVFLYKYIQANTLPKGPRRSDQLHVWYTGESPSSLYVLRRLNLTVESDYQFNLTQNYRRDSGIYHPYGKMEAILKSQRKNRKKKPNILIGKTKVAVAVVSNCYATPGAIFRVQLITRMKELGLEIDTFGRCFGDKIEERRHEFEDIMTKYKFYLAFENAFHCRDYITEKFFINGFRAGTVPVALGATKDDYLAVAPKDSFIFAEDFQSVESLVNFLNYLDKNDEEYLAYFNWIERGVESLPMRGRIGRYCQLCRQIHGINVDDVYYNSTTNRQLFTDHIVERNVPRLRRWYYGKENKLCFERTSKRIKRHLNFSDI